MFSSEILTKIERSTFKIISNRIFWASWKSKLIGNTCKTSQTWFTTCYQKYFLHKNNFIPLFNKNIVQGMTTLTPDTIRLIVKSKKIIIQKHGPSPPYLFFSVLSLIFFSLYSLKRNMDIKQTVENYTVVYRKGNQFMYKI